MLTCSREHLNLRIERVLLRCGDLERSLEILSDKVAIVSDTLSSSIDITTVRLPNCKSLNQKIFLGILSWYLPEEVRFPVVLWLDQHWGVEKKEVKDIILTSKIYALAWLQVQERWNEYDLFGNYLNERFLKGIFWRLDFVRKNEHVGKQYNGWCRGHRDGKSLIHPRDHLIPATEEEIARFEDWRMSQEVVYQMNLIKLQRKVDERILNSA